MDKMVKECHIEPIMYRNQVNIPKLGFVDDNLDVTKCGNHTQDMNNYTNSEINKRKLQLNVDKCVRMHVQKKGGTIHKCKDLKIDCWGTKRVIDEDSNVCLEDEYKGKTNIKTVDSHLYLGNLISSTGSDQLTINERVSKGQAAVRDILHILEGTYFGDFYFEALKLLRNMMVTSILTYNIEIL